MQKSFKNPHRTPTGLPAARHAAKLRACTKAHAESHHTMNFFLVWPAQGVMKSAA